MTNFKPMSWLLFLVAFTASSLWLAGCSDENTGPMFDEGGDISSDVRATCEECHTNEAMLKATAEDEGPPPESTGEG